jgi:hypothetical protein
MERLSPGVPDASKGLLGRRLDCFWGRKLGGRATKAKAETRCLGRENHFAAVPSDKIAAAISLRSLLS